jgi:hypothetical protein
MYCIFQKASKKDFECFCHWEIMFGRYLCNGGLDLYITQCVHVLKHHIDLFVCILYIILSVNN